MNLITNLEEYTKKTRKSKTIVIAQDYLMLKHRIQSNPRINLGKVEIKIIFFMSLQADMIKVDINIPSNQKYSLKIEKILLLSNQTGS